eukprot:TRINITY_DN105_c1_g3_i1.p2 TRINITY_DN105_c1_g3~~TRINITY_DN105_c1_g3_i1.p2  ORF type:complete len:225 (+),score=88.65 TRINITY_DN105_c1_g3_i1:76-675(+)
MAPQTVWAERPDVLMVTIQVVDAADVAVNFEAEAFEFKAKVGGNDVTMKLELKNEVIPEESSFVNTMREVQIKMKKKEEGPYWNSLTKKKMNNVKIDWSRWVDEDELDGADAGGEFGGMPGGMGDMGGMGGMPGGMGGMDMQQMMAQMGGMGGMGGMPGMGGEGMPDMSELMAGAGAGAGAEGDSDDEEPPAAEPKTEA